jgi:hypothetical protein
MKYINNFNKFKYNKFNLYYNEWYENHYSFNKYNSLFIYINTIKDIFNIYFNKSYNLNKYINGANNKLTKNIYIDILDIKLFINKLIINIHIYNREKIWIIKKLKFLKMKKIYNIVNLYLYREILKKKLFFYNYYICKLFFNNYKFNTHNLLKIKNIFNVLFLKKIVLRFSSIKYVHTNNNLLLKFLTKKINLRKITVLKLLRKSIKYANIAKINFLLKIKKINKHINNKFYNNMKLFINRKKIKNSIFFGSSNIHLLGLRLEAKGRITKRLKASRSLKKIKYKGSLINIYSTINKNSTSHYKGFEKSNISYVKHNNYNILGTYGLKYWINSY